MGVIRKLRTHRADRHDRIADHIVADLNNALRVYLAVCDTPEDAQARLDELPTTEFYRAKISLHRTLANKWRP